MLEIPEAHAVAAQITSTLKGRRIAEATAAHSPHKFAWYYGDPAEYAGRLIGREIGDALPVGGMVEIAAQDTTLVFDDGTALRFHEPAAMRPAKHQLLIEFEDASAFSVSVQMYGGVWCFPAGPFESSYYQAGKNKPSPLTDEFTEAYFDTLVAEGRERSLSVKAMLTTESRISGLGNGVLQDILFEARMHPKRKLASLDESDLMRLYRSVRATLSDMAADRGRDTETDLLGKPGGYVTRMSRNTVGKPCSRCGATICKETWMGGSIYWCPGCQPE